MAIVSRPLETLTVLEAGGPGGCTAPRKATVLATAMTGDCEVAVNAGFFNVSSGACLGNVVSDGRVVQTSREQNVHFGLRKDGTIFVGYLTPEMISNTSNPFVQLVAGFLWLIRDGQAYLEESLPCEHDDTGYDKRAFVNLISARTIVGHDSHGRAVLFQVDGKSWARGADLNSLVTLLLRHDIVNAINLDGGGSATTVINGTVASAPSENCGQDMSCIRPVTTVLCVRRLQAAPSPSVPPSPPASTGQTQSTLVAMGLGMFLVGVLVTCISMLSYRWARASRIRYSSTRPVFYSGNSLYQLPDHQPLVLHNDDEYEDEEIIIASPGRT